MDTGKRYVPNLTSAMTKAIDSGTLCQPCQEEDLDDRYAVALVDGVPMCHDCACTGLDF